MPASMSTSSESTQLGDDVDLERRFGGLRRLYGDAGYARLRAAHVVVIGLGGVGSWAVEALARSGIAKLTLVDLDHVSESNINRQIQATTATLGMAKGEALAERVKGIHPGCVVRVIDAFVEAGNWPSLVTDHFSGDRSAVAPNEHVEHHAWIDACDDARAKFILAAWALSTHRPLVSVGAAGGKRRPQAIDLADLADVTHDPLLARLRQRLRREQGLVAGQPMGLACIYSREAVALPVGDDSCVADGTLNCHGYGSSVAVTASFGMAAAAWAIERCVEGDRADR